METGDAVVHVAATPKKALPHSSQRQNSCMRAATSGGPCRARRIEYRPASLADLLALWDSKRVVPSEQACRRLQRRADRLCFLIVATDIPERDVKIERLFLRTETARLFPDKLSFYDMLYESRFRRLWQQFRASSTAHS